MNKVELLEKLVKENKVSLQEAVILLEDTPKCCGCPCKNGVSSPYNTGNTYTHPQFVVTCSPSTCSTTYTCCKGNQTLTNG